MAGNGKNFEFVPVYSGNTDSVDTAETLARIESKIDQLAAEIGQIKEIVCTHSVILQALSKTLLETPAGVHIFPIATIDDFQKAEEKIMALQEHEAIAYIKIKCGSADAYKALNAILSDQVKLKVNWNGSKGKVALKDYRLFNYYLFEAMKTTYTTFPDYEKSMREAFRKIKVGIYRKTYAQKQQ